MLAISARFAGKAFLTRHGWTKDINSTWPSPSCLPALRPRSVHETVPVPWASQSNGGAHINSIAAATCLLHTTHQVLSIASRGKTNPAQGRFNPYNSAKPGPIEAFRSELVRHLHSAISPELNLRWLPPRHHRARIGLEMEDLS
jgi:hypothetical protein